MQTKALTQRRYRTLLEIVFLFIVPVLLLYFNSIARQQFLAVLAIYTSFILIIVLKEHWTLRTLDIRLDNLQKCLLPYALFTVVSVSGLIGIATLLGTSGNVGVNLYILFLAWSLPIAIVQEFLYRGFLMRELRLTRMRIAAVIIVNALLFTFLHIIYNPPLIILPMTLIGGIGFAWMYTRYPNLVLIAISHSILNFFAIWCGFFRI